ncbi:MAG: hypothetical protein SFY70_06910 [Bacteroidia bacterium]|nr:hypothetical protein [Bacteroidia bacterium]
MGAGPSAAHLTERDREVLGVIAQHPGCVDRLVVRLCYQGTAEPVASCRRFLTRLANRGLLYRRKCGWYVPESVRQLL